MDRNKQEFRKLQKEKRRIGTRRKRARKKLDENENEQKFIKEWTGFNAS